MISKIFQELKEHSPFTALATALAILIVVFIYYFLDIMVSEEVFHLFHFAHIIVSAMVTAGIFYKYKVNFISAILVGLTGAIIIGTLSDVLFPYFAGKLLGLEIHFHLPLVEESLFVISFALLGAFIGTMTRITKSPHFIHVFLSVFASLFYILAFSPAFVFGYFMVAFFIVFVAVIIPCCLSDIVFPLLFVNSKNIDNTN